MVGRALDPAAGVEQVVETTAVHHPGPLHYQLLTDPVAGHQHHRLGVGGEAEAVGGQFPGVDDGGSERELRI